MKLLGKHSGRKVYWFDFSLSKLERLPKSDWICFAISDSKPNTQLFSKFVRYTLDNGILEFKGHGQFGEKLHNIFDETLTRMEVYEKYNPISICTTSHNGESLYEAFWQCFYSTCLPSTTNYDNLKIICTSLDGKNYQKELLNCLNQIEND